MTAQPGLCQIWSETPKTGFLTTRPIQNWDKLWNEEKLASAFPTEKEERNIELPEGSDYYWEFILPQRIVVLPDCTC